MRTATWCLIATGAILVQQAAMADKGGGASDLVKALDGAGLEATGKGSWDKPTVITSSDELVKLFGEKAAGVQRIQKEVDFTKQQVLCFSWSGSGADNLAYAVKEGKDGVHVEFNFTAGMTRDLRQHLKLFVLPKDAKYTINN